MVRLVRVGLLLALCSSRESHAPTPAFTAPTFLPPALTTVLTPGEQGYQGVCPPGIQSLNGTLLLFSLGREYGCGDFAGVHVCLPSPPPTPFTAAHPSSAVEHQPRPN